MTRLSMVERRDCSFGNRSPSCDTRRARGKNGVPGPFPCSQFGRPAGQLGDRRMRLAMFFLIRNPHSRQDLVDAGVRLCPLPLI